MNEVKAYLKKYIKCSDFKVKEIKSFGNETGAVILEFSGNRLYTIGCTLKPVGEGNVRVLVPSSYFCDPRELDKNIGNFLLKPFK